MEAAQIATQKLQPSAKEAPPASRSNWKQKFLTMKKKCDQIEQANDILYAKSRQIYKMIHRAEAEKKVLMERLEQYEAEGMEVGVQAAGKRVKVGETLSPPPPPPLLPHTLLAANLPDIGRQFSLLQEAILAPSSATEVSKFSPLITPSLQPNQRTESTKVSKQASLMQASPYLNPSSTPVSPKTVKKTSKSRTKNTPASRRRKGNRDLSAPKKPSNAFFWFCQEQRSSFEEQFRGEGVAGQHSLTKILAQKWAETSAEEKKVYYLKYGVDKKRYEREMQAYQLKRQEQQQMQQSASAVSASTNRP